MLALGDPQVACEVARDNPLLLVVLDPVQMDVDDLALCQMICANPLTEHVPIVLLLTREREIAQMLHLGLRITDYVLKPLLWEEFRACVQTLLRFRRQERPARRARPDHRTLPPALSQDETVLTAGDLSIDLGGRRVWHHGHLLELTRPVLFDLFVYLVRFRGIALTRKELLTQVWGYRTPEELNGDTHTVSVHIRLLTPVAGREPGGAPAHSDGASHRLSVSRGTAVKRFSACRTGENENNTMNFKRVFNRMEKVRKSQVTTRINPGACP